ncbi:MAG: CHC2 zinc finger domain-containing protein [Vicinamibacterales bacterium]
MASSFLERRGDERYGNCPFCAKAAKFYVNTKTQLWQCKVCGRKGSRPQFLQQMAKVYEDQMTPQLLRRLAEDRQLPEKAFVGWHVGWDGRHYTLPVFNAKGEAEDIRLHRLGRHPIATKDCSVGLFGAQQLAAQLSAPVYLCEGEWDTIALNFLRQRVAAPGVCVGVPGAGILKAEWCELFRNRVVRTHYDHDEAGAKGEQLAAQRLAGIAQAVSHVRWPKSKPDGYDVRDWVTAAPSPGRLRLPQLVWTQLERWTHATPRLGAPEGAADADALQTAIAQLHETYVYVESTGEFVNKRTRQRLTPQMLDRRHAPEFKLGKKSTTNTASQVFWNEHGPAVDVLPTAPCVRCRLRSSSSPTLSRPSAITRGAEC